VWGGSADIRGTKLYAAASVRSQARLALTCLLAFWPARRYWRDVFGATVMPRWLTLRRYAPDSRSVLATAPPAAASISLAGAIAASMNAGGCVATALTLENRGRRTVFETGPGAVTVGQRWVAHDGHRMSASELALNQLAALPQTLPRAVRPGRRLQFQFSLYPPPTPGRYRLELAAHCQQLGWLDEEDRRTLVAAEVEVR
jgi:hypothetical protein